MRDDAARRARRDLLRLASSGLDWTSLAARTDEVLQRVVSYDHACWHTLDPATLVFTGAMARNLPDAPELPHYEYAVPDVNKWAFLARSLWPVGILSEATHGDLGASPRWRGMLAPHSITDELRASFVADGTAWGAMALFRSRPAPDFAPDEARFVAAVSSIVADGFRKALLVTAALPDGSPDGPGVVVFDDAGEIESTTPAASRWIEELIAPESVGPPAQLRAIAERARAVADGTLRPDERALARVYTRSGRWLVLHGTRLEGSSGARVTVIIEPASPADVAPLILMAYGLSDRERQVVQAVMRGSSTAEIARELSISPHTVQDHLKAIFEKVGVRSRRDLVARAFNEHYWPMFTAFDVGERDWGRGARFSPADTA